MKPWRGNTHFVLAIAALFFCTRGSTQKSRLLNINQQGYSQQSNPGHAEGVAFQTIGDWVYFPATTLNGRDWFRVPAKGRATHPVRVSDLSSFQVEDAMSEIVVHDAETMLFVGIRPQKRLSIFATSLGATSFGQSRRVADLVGATPPTSGKPATITRIEGSRFHLVTTQSRAWLTDGSAAGTRVLAPKHFEPLFSPAASKRLLCSSDDGGSPPKTTLVAIDGATATLHPITSLDVGDRVAPSTARLLGSRWLFLVTKQSAGAELWTSDGTPAGTRRVLAHATAPSDKLGTSAFATVLAGRYYYFVRDPQLHMQLWSSDGTSAGTKVEVQWTASRSMYGTPNRLAGRIGFPYHQSSTIHYAIYDPATQKTSVFPAPEVQRAYALPGGKIQMLTAGAAASLYESDGTAAGTRKLVDFPTKTAFHSINERNPGHYILRTSTVTGPWNETDLEPHVFEPGDTAVRLLTDLFPERLDGPTWVNSVAKAKSRVAIYVYNSVGVGNGLWSTAGTQASTKYEFYPRMWSDLMHVNKRAIFVGVDSNSNPTSGLWAWDDAKLHQVYSWAHGYLPSPLGTLHGEAALEMLAWQVHELWTSDGTAAGTRLRMQLPWQETAEGIASLPGTSRFVALAKRGVYASDSTASRMNAVRLWGDAVRPVARTGLTATAHGFVFAATDASSGAELWVTDGKSQSGTRLLADIVPGSASSNPSDFASAGSVAFFTAGDSRGRELWCTDGTASGTRMVLDFYPGPESSDPKGTVCVGLGEVAFAARHPTRGREVWRCDASGRRVRLVADYNARRSSEAKILARIDDELYCLADDGLHGFELFITPLRAASWTSNATCPHDPHPVLRASTPRIGKAFRLEGTALTSGEVSAIFLGTPPSNSPSPCTPAWDTSQAFVLAAAWRANSADFHVELKIPESRALVGSRCAAQCLQLSRNASQLFRWSNGIECVIGH